MIYFVSNQKSLFNSDNYQVVSVYESLEILNPMRVVGLDTETGGLDVHTKELLCIQLGNYEDQVVIDCTSIDIQLYKEYLESDRLFLGWNLCFDLKFLYHVDIYPENLYDGMLAEKLLWLGYPPGMHGMSLKDAAYNYLGLDLDKTIRGKIINTGLTDDVIVYAAHDVKYLEKIKDLQQIQIKAQELINAVDFENKVLKVVAYIEYCGAKIDTNKWGQKMVKDKEALEEAKKRLDDWVVKWENEKLEKDSEVVYIEVYKGKGLNVIEQERAALKKARRCPDKDVDRGYSKWEAYEFVQKRKYSRIDSQGSLWDGFDLTPKCTVNWGSSKQVIELFEDLGIDVTTVDKSTKKTKKSVQDNVIAPQQHKFPIIPLYREFKKAEILVNTFGDKFLKNINPKTGRVHANFHQLGTDTARFASSDPNLQNLPKDAFTRSCFVAEKGNKWISRDYSGQESYVLAYLSNDQAMLDELLNGSGDLHSLTARLVFDEIPNDMPLKEIKSKFHDLRQEAKGYEFAFAYGGNDSTLVKNYGISKKKAKEVYDKYMNGFAGMCAYQEYCRQDVLNKGYILLNKLGHRAHIYDYDSWDYLRSENPSAYRKRVAESQKQSINYRIQSTGAVMFKLASILFFKYLKEHNLLKIVKYCIPAHDEINVECPEYMVEEIDTVLAKCMYAAGIYFCPTAPLKSEASIGDFWIH